jgi:6-pyruvoyltetrahydropterin/6-carboxytetrahydropterin synthase
MIYQLSQRFFFEAAHSLDREIETDASQRIHGHTYWAELTIEGSPDAKSGMVMDLGQVRRTIDVVRDQLDHRMLNGVDGLGAPTLENLCAYLWKHFEQKGCMPAKVTVRRDAMGDSCTLTKKAADRS